MLSAYAADVSVDFDLGNSQSLSVSATVSLAPIIVGEIQICDGTCAYTKSIDPATEFTVRAVATGGDLNTDSFDVYFYQTSDTNSCSVDWDCIQKFAITGATANGCEQTGDVYCLTIPSTDWSTKFISGDADFWVRAEGIGGSDDFNESVGTLTINTSTGTIVDTSAATYSIVPDTAQNAILTDQANAYIISTHNGNVNLDLDVNGDDFSDNGNTIDKSNQKFNTTDNYGGATAIDGTPQNFLSNWVRGTHPSSSIQNLWFWLDCPALQPAGDYNSTLTFGSEAS